ncbi:hypothetical protein MUN84_06290 [Hymenobacter sp. 5516J-16]|uniref:hypothetical protein n=1 Tax=Hymenobacter sp. 5516J-16 TaxID=2932253 RepID=UPI001FD476C1|nr:hypothetical protein [Hymenobacter sp. 5516J-16]UOQ78199.1 hypothetical protein MUN84_06290 [Hymenobacter sp. 5516J-16]
MPDRIITFCYRKIIGASSGQPWEKLVFEDTYQEFRLQAQLYNPERRYRTFGELVHHAPGAEQLHFLVSAAARGYLQQLGGLVPDVLDNLGKHFLKFSQFQFEIINSDLQDKSRHQVAINFYSEPLRWHDTVGSFLLVSEAAGPAVAPGEVRTNMVQLQPYLSIYSLQQLA